MAAYASTAASHSEFQGELARAQAERAARHHPERSDPYFLMLQRALAYLDQRGAGVVGTVAEKQ